MASFLGYLLGYVVCGVNLYRLGKFAIVEMRSIQEASNAMQLDGIFLRYLDV